MRQSDRKPRRARGGTLVELVMSMVIAGIILAAITSSILIASHAIPSDQSPATSLSAADAAMSQLAAELSFAKSVTLPATQPASSVTFTVAPRGTDTSDETITWSWSGLAGDPVTRQYNGGAPAVIAGNVQQFSLTFNKTSTTTTQAVPTMVTSPEQLFAQFTGWSGLFPATKYYAATNTSWCNEYFKIDPAFFPVPPNAASLQITRVRLMLAAGSPSAPSFSVGIYPPAVAGKPQPGPQPMGTPLTVLATSLTPSYAWMDLTFTDVTTSNLSQDFVIVVKGNPGSTSTGCSVQYSYSVLASPVVPVMTWTTDSGTTYGPAGALLNQNNILFYVYGTYTAPQVQQTSTTQYNLSTVAATLSVGTPGPNGPSMVSTVVPIYNKPAVAGP